MKDWSWRYWVAIGLVAFGFIILLLFTATPAYYLLFNNEFIIEYAGNYGDFIGGLVGSLFSLAGVVLIFETLNKQRIEFQRQQFESKFFELLKVHHENIKELESKDIKSRQVFVKIKDEFFLIYFFLKEFFASRNFKIETEKLYNISYLVLFYGVGPCDDLVVRAALKGLLDDELLDSMIKALEGKKNEYENNYYLDGHQSNLGHYFRHLYNTIQFADNQKFLNLSEKYEYVKLLRSQLSNYELAIFFINSISDLGKDWELTQPIVEEKLITKYQLVKNIPDGFLFDIDLKSTYPQVKYKFEEVRH